MATSHGQGSVYGDRSRGVDGRGRFNSYIGEVTLDGKRRKVRAATKRDASAKLARLVAEHERGETVLPRSVTVERLLDQWLASQPETLAPKTAENNRWAVRVLRAELGAIRARDLTVVHVESALRRIADGGQSPSGRPASQRQLVLMRATLRRVLKFGARRGFVGGSSTTAAEYAEIPADARRRTRRVALTPDQARVLWEALARDAAGAMFQLQLLTGLRPGEAAGLCWDAVDLDAGVLSIRRALQIDSDRAVLVERLKTSASRRAIALTPEAVAVLREQQRRVEELRTGAKTWHETNLCFPSTTGTPRHPRNSRRDLARISLAAGLPPVRPNELRHTAASLLSDRGVPHAHIADLLGHTTTRMVDETYRHNLRSVADGAVVGGLGSIVTGPTES